MASIQVLIPVPHGGADGYLARYDRVISVAISRLLLRTPITPNQITTLSLLLAILGAGLLVRLSYPQQLIGALFLWASCILDGCDGEVARLKLMHSRQGAVYDLAADHLCHVVTFAAVLLHIRRMHPKAVWTIPAAVLTSGVLVCMFAVWWLILRKPEGERADAQKAFERIASRDYVYVVLLLVAAQRLHWFMWSAAIGSHVFWLSLWWVSRWTATGGELCGVSASNAAGKDILPAHDARGAPQTSEQERIA